MFDKINSPNWELKFFANVAFLTSKNSISVKYFIFEVKIIELVMELNSCNRFSLSKS